MGRGASQTDQYSFVSHRSDDIRSWKPGSYGKGLVAEGSGIVYTWPVTLGSSRAVPTHEEVAEQLQLGIYAISFHIHPDGNTDLGAEDLKYVRKQEPRLHTNSPWKLIEHDYS